MEKGFIGHSNRMQSRWIEGNPVRSCWLGELHVGTGGRV